MSSAAQNAETSNLEYGAAAVCYDYGCPEYPMELDIIEKAFQREKPTGKVVNGALLTQQSNEHSFNQDKAVYLSPFQTHQTTDMSSFLVGLFDGHGEDGHVVAKYAAENFPKRLAEKFNQRLCCENSEWIKQQINATFHEINDELPPFSGLRGGCTASVSIRMGATLYIANAGDSRTLVVGEDGQILYSTRRDKAHLPEERSRIEAMGGVVRIPPKFPNDSRVMVFSTANKPPEMIGLAMSRSLGDWEWKEVGVIAEPIIDKIDLSSEKHAFFVLAASDGVFDLRKPEFHAKELYERIYVQHADPLKSMSGIFHTVTPKVKSWYRDDMTMVFANVKDHV